MKLFTYARTYTARTVSEMFTRTHVMLVNLIRHMRISVTDFNRRN